MQRVQALTIDLSKAEYKCLEGKRRFVMFLTSAIVCLAVSIVAIILVLSISTLRKAEVIIATSAFGVALILVAARAGYLAIFVLKFKVIAAISKNMLYIRNKRGYLAVSFSEIGKVVLSIGDLFTERDCGGSFNIEIDENTFMFETDGRAQIANVTETKLMYGLIVKGNDDAKLSATSAEAAMTKKA